MFFKHFDKRSNVTNCSAKIDYKKDYLKKLIKKISTSVLYFVVYFMQDLLNNQIVNISEKVLLS